MVNRRIAIIVVVAVIGLWGLQAATYLSTRDALLLALPLVTITGLTVLAVVWIANIATRRRS
jgi:hypothetical protein